MKSPKINNKYRPLYSTDKRYIYLLGGRGSGKSYGVADFITRLSFSKGQKILYTRYTLTSAEKSVIPEFTEKLELLGILQHFEVTKDAIINKITGAEIIFSGIKTSSGNQTARLKSIQGITTWVYEEFEEHPDEESFLDIDLSIRKKGVQNRIILISNALHKQSWQYKYFFENENILKNTEHIYTNYLDNIENLNDAFIQQAETTKRTNPQRYAKHFLGRHYEDTEGTLWSWGIIDDNRVKSLPELERIVVAIDPAVTSNKDSDDTGIMVVGKAGKHGYVLEDVTGKYTPAQWATKAIAMYKKWKADRVIGEVNNGGDLIEANLRNINHNIPYSSVRATRGKAVRAEPIVALYEQARIHHLHYLPELETELTTWTPESKVSPNRMDALVWGCTELFNSKEIISFLA